MDRMNRIVSLVSSFAVTFLAVILALSLCHSRAGEADRSRALRPAASAQAPRCPLPWTHDCARDNECIA